MFKKLDWITKFSDDLNNYCSIIMYHVMECKKSISLQKTERISAYIDKIDEASKIQVGRIHKINKILKNISEKENTNLSLNEIASLKEIRHDLLNSVNVIKGYAEIITEETVKDKDDALLESISIISNNIKNISMSLGNEYLQDLLESNAAIKKIDVFENAPQSDSYVKLQSVISGRILVVEDEKLSRSLMYDWLSTKGYHVILANNGKEALDILKREYQDLDIVLLDMMMPLMSGYEVLKEIKKNQAYEAISVIMVTAVYDIDNIMQCIKEGADDYILKPFNSFLLDARIKISLERKRFEALEKESKEQLNLIANALPVLIFAFDNDLKFTFNNRACEMLFDEPVRLIKGQLLKDLFPKSAYKVILSHYQKMMSEKKYVTFELALALDHLHKNTHIFSMTLTPHISHSKIKLTFASMNDITNLKQVEERLHYMATHDTLTGLPNRNLLDVFLNKAIKSANKHHTGVAVFFLDIDHFKLINDNLGHHYGDLLLVEAAKRLQSCLRPYDIIIRMGGDEFVIILSDVKSTEIIKSIAQKIFKFVELPVVIEPHTLSITLSIGISRYPEDTRDEQKLLKYADLAMYYVKDNYRNNFQFYSNELNLKATSRMLISTDLRRALLNNEFVIYYQPIVDVSSGKTHSLEALIRWNHPQSGFLQPGEFLAIAEESGIIAEIGDWVLNSVFDQYQQWKTDSSKTKSVTINISPPHLYRKNFVASIENLIANKKIDPNDITFELSENSLMKDIEDSINKITLLKKMGIKILIDDFGSEYSSLNYLARLPIDGIKIDKSFVHAINKNEISNIIITSIIRLAHDLGISVIAEGVETEGQLEFLKNAKCNYFQGYFHSSPKEHHFSNL